MQAIKKLPPELIGQIAAGEVVERPASAVKELVENSIDAGAKHITVELKEGGIAYLRVSDDGGGIPAGQLRLAFERHATSKLSSPADLFEIRTLGFRGEALASIAAVARVTVTTRTQDADFGARAKVEAGVFAQVTQAASPVGTTIVVEDLFFNTPVRLRFLKKPSQEAALVSDYMLRLLLSRPDIAFRFAVDGKTVYRSMGDGRLESVLYSLYGSTAFKQMLRVGGSHLGVALSGYVGVGELSRGNRQQQSFFINGRYFRSAALSKALESGCEGRVMIGKFPMCALFLTLPYAQVDVNVHPNKLEVRFQNEQAVTEAVERLVSDALRAQTLSDALCVQEEAETPKDAPDFQLVALQNRAEDAPEDSLEKQLEDLRQKLRVSEPQQEPEIPMTFQESALPSAIASVMLKPFLQPSQALEPEQTAMPEVKEKPALRLVGIVFDTYWIFETVDRLLLVDQHAAHERMLYDRMMESYGQTSLSQRLLAPRLVRLNARDRALLEDLQPVLRQAGFDVEPFDDAYVSVNAIPTLFGQNAPPDELLLEALDEGQTGRGTVTRERMARRVAQMACKRAIKGGDRLSEREIEGFLEQMLTSGSMPTCPHGRPIVIEITRHALEKRFARISS